MVTKTTLEKSQGSSFKGHRSPGGWDKRVPGGLALLWETGPGVSKNTAEEAGSLAPASGTERPDPGAGTIPGSWFL